MSTEHDTVAPLWDANFADPALIRAEGAWWAFATNGPLGNVQLLRSSDMLGWEEAGDALPELPTWAEPGRTWAPEVTTCDDGYVMYYTARVAGTGLQGVGRATAVHPAGPYRDDSSAPLVFQAEEGGSIDASPFTDDDGSRYLWWKNDGNAVGQDTWLYAARLSPDGLDLAGEPHRAMRQELPWEGTLVEGPFLHRRGDTLHLFYSGNAFNSADYAVGHAVCDSPLGPARRSGDEPILATGPTVVGPGHCVVVEDQGTTWMVHHAYRPDDTRFEHGRQMWRTEVLWTERGPVCGEPGAPALTGPA